MSSRSDTTDGALTSWQHLHPAMLAFEAGRILRRLLVPLIVGGVAVSGREGGMLTLLVVSGVISVVGFVSGYLSFRYRLTRGGIELREGVVTRRQRSIALDRISHLNTDQNALARLLGVVRLEIETEGGGAPEASFAALSLAEAERIRQHIGGGAALDGGERTLYEASLRDRLLAGATTLQIGGAVALVAAAWRLLRRFDPGEGAESGALPSFLSHAIRSLDETYELVIASPPRIAVSVVLLLFGVWGLGIALAVVRWHGLRLSERDDELQLQSGVFSRSRTVIARERIQAVEIRANVLRNLLGLVQISIVSAGARRDRARSRVFVPITRDEQVGDFLDVLWPEVGKEMSWRPVHPYYRRQHITRGLGVLFLLSVVAALLLGLDALLVGGVAFLAFGLALVVWWTAAPSFLRTGYALGPGYVHVRRGAVSPRRWVVPAARIQSVLLHQSIFQRRVGVMGVTIDVNGLAGNQRIEIPSLPRAEAEALQRQLTPRGADAPSSLLGELGPAPVPERS